MEGGDILMSSIDRRVVEMEFDNAAFEAGIKDTLNSLEALKQGLKLEGVTDGLKALEGAGQGINLDGIADGVDNISSKFSALGAIGFTVIQSLTNAALDFAKRTAGAIFDPLVAGGKRRALNIEQAKFQFRGLGMDVEETMDSALKAVTGTAYGLDEAAKVAGQFGASGMRAGDDMTSALRAISGVAAMTNSSYEDIGNVFTKVAGNGRVMGDDLLRMSSRGLNAAATLAESMGISEQAVREMVTEGEISFEMFYEAMDKAFGENATKANETYSGSLANLRAAFSRIGAGFFTPWLEQQRDLFNALSPAVDAVGAALKPVVGQLTQFTGRGTQGLIRFIEGLDLSRLSLVFTPIMAIAKNLYQAVKAFLLPVREAFRQIFPPASLEQINEGLKVIQKFTAGLKIEGGALYDLHRVFAGIFAVFGIGWEFLKSFAKFLFEIFDALEIGSGGFLQAAANVGDFLVELHEAVKAGEGFTLFFDGVRKALEPIISTLKRVGAAIRSLFDFQAPDASEITESFGVLPRIGEVVLEVWSKVVDGLGRLWGGIRTAVRKFGEIMEPVIGWFRDTFGSLNYDDVLRTFNTGFIGTIAFFIKQLVDGLGNRVGTMVYRITQPFNQLTITLGVMQNTLRAMTLMQIAVAIGILALSVVALSKVDAAGLAKAMTAISGMMVQLVVAMKALTMLGGTPGLISTGVALIALSVAIRILASAVKALAELSWEELAKGLTGVTVLIAALTLAVRGMSGHTAGMLKAGAGLLVLALGIKVLASAVKDISGLSWEEMAKGLVGVGALLASLAIFTRLAAVNKGGLAQGAGLLLLAAGIKVLASAVEDFAGLSWEEIGKGLSAVTAVLVAFAIFSRTVGRPDKLLASGAAMIMIGAAMKILASAMADFASLSWEEMAKGLLAMAGALLAITVALNLMPPNTLASAVALIAVSVALNLIAVAMQQFAGMTWEELARGLVALAGSLTIIAIAMMLMTSALPGAAALLVVSAALRLFVPVLQALGSMSFAEIATGLITLAAAFAVLGIAGLVLGPLAPVLLVLGAAIALIGLGMLGAGAGVLFFSIALTALAAAGTAAGAALVGFIVQLLKLLPIFAEQLGLAIIAFAEVIGTAGPSIARAMTAVMGAIIESIRNNVPNILMLVRELVTEFLVLLVDLAPKVAKAALQIMLAILKELTFHVPLIIREVIDLVVSMLEELSKGVPQFVKAATALMVAFLESIADNLGDVIEAGVDIVISLVESIGEQGVRLANAAADALVDFLNGLATAIDRQAPRIRAAGKNIAGSIISGMTGGLTDGVNKVATKAKDVARSAMDAAKNFLGISSPSKAFIALFREVGNGAVVGLEESSSVVSRAAQGLGEETIETMKRSLIGLSDLFDMNADLHPTITPVLDLTEFDKRADYISSALSGQRVTVDVAYSQAKDAAILYRANEAARYATSTLDGFTEPQPAISYTQNNYSPKALTSAEIYRQTKNQLSVTKGALTPNVAQDA
jgi:tape measure domain-containing protein